MQPRKRKGILAALITITALATTPIHAATITNQPIQIAVSDPANRMEYTPYHGNDYLLFPGGKKVYLDSNRQVIRNGYVIDEFGDLNMTSSDGTVNASRTYEPRTGYSYSSEKKGLQGDYILTESGITGSHMLLNFYLDLADSTEPSNLTYELNGNTYYFNEDMFNVFKKRIKEAQTRDIKVTIVVLLRGNAHCAAMNMMSSGSGATNPSQIYSLNPGSEATQAFLEMLASQLSSDGCHVENWILGNEVNMPNTYNHTGSNDVEKNVSLYARTFKVFSDAVTKFDPYSKLYISLDHSWTDNAGGAGIPGKDFLNQFHLKMKEIAPGVQWNIAFHLYPPDLTKTASMWQNPELNTNETTTPFISPVNLSVLTGYIKDHIGADKRVILSEQGANAKEGETMQATGIAFEYAAAEADPMVDAVIFRSYRDEGTDGQLDLGLVTTSGQREAFQVYQALGTPSWPSMREKYVSSHVVDQKASPDNKSHQATTQTSEAVPPEKLKVVNGSKLKLVDGRVPAGKDDGEDDEREKVEKETENIQEIIEKNVKLKVVDGRMRER